MRILLLSLLTVFLFGCKKEIPINDTVILTLLNDSLTYVDLGDRTWYDNGKEVDSAWNVVHYRISNNSNKKQLFLLRSIELHDNESMYFTIEEDSVFKQGVNVLINPALNDCGVCILESNEFNRKLETQKIKKIGVKKLFNFNKNYERQKIIINPGESWDFKTLLSLPVVDENYRFKFYPNLSYTISLSYQVRIDDFDNLPEFEKQNLKRNNVVVFSGKLISNKVKLVQKELW
mgnify:CR=1 FL=1